MVSIEARSRQMCDRFYFNTNDELAWYPASDAHFSSHLKICCFFSELISENASYCYWVIVVHFLFCSNFSPFLFLNVVWKDFVNVKLLGIDNNNATFVFSNGHNYSQQIISQFFRITLNTHSVYLVVSSANRKVESQHLFPHAAIFVLNVHWMWETLVTHRGKKSNQHVTWTLEQLLNERLLDVLMGIVEGALL